MFVLWPLFFRQLSMVPILTLWIIFKLKPNCTNPSKDPLYSFSVSYIICFKIYWPGPDNDSPCFRPNNRYRSDKVLISQINGTSCFLLTSTWLRTWRTYLNFHKKSIKFTFVFFYFRGESLSSHEPRSNQSFLVSSECSS